MHFQVVPDALTKIAQLGDVTLFEPAGDQPQSEKREFLQPSGFADCITHVATPKGPKPILKTMVTTACERNCYYCPFRAGRSKTRRVSFKPDELAGAFDTMQRAGAVDGLFLSSGIIKGSVTTQDKIIDTVEIVRRKYAYRGYIHLKIMPGIEYDQLHRAMQLADRVSVNLEGPTQQRLEALAPKKDFFPELLTMLQWAAQIREQHPTEKLASTVTQFVVGAVGDTDLELLAISEKLYRQMQLARAYYSPFSPVEQTPFESLAPVDLRREHRLYQASFLLRDYGWNLEEFSFASAGNLPLHLDPKQAWAEQYLRHAPVDIMKAGRSQLLRVPGIGPKTADLILKARRTTHLTDLAQLRQLGIRSIERVAPYILLDGRQPPHQLAMF
jgi:predicted DNA-binding helix-hairpin-helix protein